MNEITEQLRGMAEEVGEIKVDYGDSTCKPFDALATLRSERVKTRLSKK